MKQRCKLTLTIIIILASSLLWAIQPQPAQAMKRESKSPDLIIQPGDLAQALDLSLSLGDGRKVDFSPFGLSWAA